MIEGTKIINYVLTELALVSMLMLTVININ